MQLILHVTMLKKKKDGVFGFLSLEFIKKIIQNKNKNRNKISKLAYRTYDRPDPAKHREKTKQLFIKKKKVKYQSKKVSI